MTFRLHSLAYVTPVLFTVLALGSAHASAQSACGCSCGNDGGPFGRIAVDPQFTSVNPRVFVRLGALDPESLRWIEVATGAEIPIHIESAGDSAGLAQWVTPTETLAPETDYEISVDSATAGQPITMTLHTASSEDHEAPPAPGLHAETPSAGDLCDEVVGGELVIDEGTAFDFQDSPVYDVELVRDGDVVGRAVFPAGGWAVFGDDTGSINDCLGGARVAGLIEGEELVARARMWDAAGNASPIVESTFVVGRAAARPAGSNCPYCSILGAGASRGSRGTAMFFAAIALVAIGRRRLR